MQYQVKLNNVVKKDWTAIGKNQPVSYTFKNANITAGVLPFTIVVRDSEGGEKPKTNALPSPPTTLPLTSPQTIPIQTLTSRKENKENP
ncbi:hypothetical protein BLGI_3358 [Brevibacillus laterosporus GI-9]|uniref:hypothetical protein n=1 Tax=Brevibacillus TaxID=55080 RepID=UPI00024050A6|nr:MULTISPECIES: hypothetical protein [Brevibacillus]MCR8966084.1 hypothetical protein [Brevibacillus laterosporus]MCZ0838241.1 hypothetical protein [Brevibacillus halotolerans]CCF15416.1 hypothetical protein BLGI_3358 [Brevibacillus laterosporus GI-9]